VGISLTGVQARAHSNAIFRANKTLNNLHTKNVKSSYVNFSSPPRIQRRPVYLKDQLRFSLSKILRLNTSYGQTMTVIDQRLFKVAPGNDGEHERGGQAGDGNTRKRPSRKEML
jgi:hypothetical protein